LFLLIGAKVIFFLDIICIMWNFFVSLRQNQDIDEDEKTVANYSVDDSAGCAGTAGGG
jgi:hypothetical protein